MFSILWRQQSTITSHEMPEAETQKNSFDLLQSCISLVAKVILLKFFPLLSSHKEDSWALHNITLLLKAFGAWQFGGLRLVAVWWSGGLTGQLGISWGKATPVRFSAPSILKPLPALIITLRCVLLQWCLKMSGGLVDRSTGHLFGQSNTCVRFSAPSICLLSSSLCDAGCVFSQRWLKMIRNPS